MISMTRQSQTRADNVGEIMWLPVKNMYQDPVASSRGNLPKVINSLVTDIDTYR
jgi:hypothetical protein